MYKVINAENYNKGAIVTQVVRHTCCIWGGLEFKSCVCH